MSRKQSYSAFWIVRPSALKRNVFTVDNINHPVITPLDPVKNASHSKISTASHSSKMAGNEQDNCIMAEIGTAANQAVVSNMSDRDMVINYCLQNKVTKDAIKELFKWGYCSMEAQQLVELENLVSPKIPKG